MILPIILLLYNGFDLIRLSKSVEEVFNEKLETEDLDFTSPFQKYLRVKNALIIFISGSLLLLNIYYNKFSFVARFCIWAVIVVFILLLLVFLIFELLVNKFETLKELFDNLRDDLYKIWGEKVLEKFKKIYWRLGVFFITLSYILMVICFAKIMKTTIHYKSTGLILFDISIIAFLLYQGVKNFFKMREYLYFLEKFQMLKDVISKDTQSNEDLKLSYTKLIDLSSHLKLKL